MTILDYALVGGGLQNGLCALALAARRPGARIAIFERAPRLGGDHTWSFHAGDVPAELADVIPHLVVAAWDRYDVAFPGLRRTLEEPYASISSARLHEAVTAAVGDVRLGVEVTRAAPGELELASGERVRARVVIDARGPAPAIERDGAGWQIFVGLELALARPAPLAHPMLMDATVEQRGGFRFLYVLPLGPRRVLVEDTVYADTPALDEAAFEARALAHAAALGLEVTAVVRRERGALPIPWKLDEAAPLEGEPGAYLLHAGWAGGWFHPTTGYSLPVAARLAAHVATRPPEALADGLPALLARHRRASRFARLLSRMLFRNFAPEDRRNVLERFYRLPVATIRRFYALDPSAADKARILCGRPPRGLRLHRAGTAAVAPEAA